nr:probable RNA polymerase II nuclear localization protein SLC7A6OS [Leptinotarsa decemlineata]XP_023018307.1 probable RNA polymerase II nuclear localization protein SLC7A6OS [Leptinotarsa decemlineata]XP_023018308.1 probable RNA polymerase II nuclear localization protein SLC7A6OS [Leptinotarsa decemlineata]
MATVVRVKRRCDDEPIEAFIFSCKRRKISSDDPLYTTVFKFARTLEKDTDISSQLDAAKYADIQKIKNNIKKRDVDINVKLRAEHKESSKRNRFKIVNRFRSQAENDSDSETGVSKSVTVLDLENDLEGNTDVKPDSHEGQDKYVYDMYYNYSGEVKDTDIEEYLSIEPVHDYFSTASLADDDDLSSDTESEDSNAENNERNEYPNESDVESIDENDMMEAMQNMNMHDYSSSSDYDEDDYTWGEDDKISDLDVRHHGKLYAMFKAKYKEEVDSDLEDDFSE